MPKRKLQSENGAGSKRRKTEPIRAQPICNYNLRSRPKSSHKASFIDGTGWNRQRFAQRKRTTSSITINSVASDKECFTGDSTSMMEKISSRHPVSNVCASSDAKSCQPESDKAASPSSKTKALEGNLTSLPPSSSELKDNLPSKLLKSSTTQTKKTKTEFANQKLVLPNDVSSHSCSMRTTNNPSRVSTSCKSAMHPKEQTLTVPSTSNPATSIRPIRARKRLRCRKGSYEHDPLYAASSHLRKMVRRMEIRPYNLRSRKINN